MNSELKQEQGATENTLKNTIYSIGVDKTPNFRERIAHVHGKDSEVVKAADELDCYVSDPETRKSAWYWNFFNKVRSRMWCLYPHSSAMVRTQMAGEFMDDTKREWVRSWLTKADSDLPSARALVAVAEPATENCGVSK